jgi:hypothetical protein
MSLIHADWTAEKVRRLLSDLFRALPHREKRFIAGAVMMAWLL